MADDRELVQPRNVTLLPSHWATIEAYGKDQGYDSISASLRRIVDEWAAFKKAQFYATRSNLPATLQEA